MRVCPQSVGIIHFVGIGGIGMSGIAEVLHSLNYSVRGSDLTENANVQRLKKLGIPVFIGHQSHQVDDAALVVVSSDIKSDNVELQQARILSLPIVRRAEMLAELMRLKPSIAVAGTHGKTSTTSLGATVLEAGGLDPTVVSGGIINAYGTNARLGSGEWIIVEADESDGTFTKLPATHAIVTNIDPEHMSHYGSFSALKDAFHSFLSNIPFYGLGIVCIDHPEIRAMLPRLTDRRVVTYGFSQDADIKAENIEFNASGSQFDVCISERFLTICKNAVRINHLSRIRLSMFGEHNVQNALSILALALELGIDPMAIHKGFASFKGVKRRFTKTGEVNGITIIDDYAHHPVEIEVVLKTARQVSQGKIIAVLQPHRYSRLKELYESFCSCFKEADHVIVAPIYAAGEEPIIGLHHEQLASDIRKHNHTNVVTIQEREELASTIMTLGHSGDMVVCLGAGSISAWAQALPEELKQWDKLDNSNDVLTKRGEING
ncbi:MAG: UDP-N-acetylmuramate--L-alanine ligase [Candidatus Paracaedimonas acanthamoebae]|uniref:UDP-N-acetylmuramate--L-alanine ligase n=1 Tax=Candidatus Paracaedimonas acanthamoebae TaxID=244581 RepID=A0A8J7PRI3_9PROT|nr:UDP-N-acetylmuramate--L-alanine ligase [Candidatus Paracaedimonas acanthamoebae]